MKITYSDESLRRVCANREALERAFGAMWTAIANFLTVLLGMESLGGLTTVALVTVRRIGSSIAGIAEFVIALGSLEVSLRANVTGDDQDERNLMNGIRSVCISGIHVSATAAA